MSFSTKKPFSTAKKFHYSNKLLAALNNLVEQYLLFAEGQAMRRIPMYMRDWIAKLHGFLTLNSREILQHAGRISHDMAKEFAEHEYDKFQQKRLERTATAPSDFDRAVQVLPPKRPSKPKRER